MIPHELAALVGGALLIAGGALRHFAPLLIRAWAEEPRPSMPAGTTPTGPTNGIKANLDHLDQGIRALREDFREWRATYRDDMARLHGRIDLTVTREECAAHREHTKGKE